VAIEHVQVTTNVVDQAELASNDVNGTDAARSDPPIDNLLVNVAREVHEFVSVDVRRAGTDAFLNPGPAFAADPSETGLHLNSSAERRTTELLVPSFSGRSRTIAGLCG
jgi:hypothetical protein